MSDLADRVRAFALSLPGAHEDFPWGDTVWKVDGKVFVFAGTPREDGSFGFSVKLPERAAEVLERPYAKPTGYGLGKSGWVSITVTPDGGPDADTVLGWIEASYRAVAKKRRIKELDGR